MHVLHHTHVAVRCSTHNGSVAANVSHLMQAMTISLPGVSKQDRWTHSWPLIHFSHRAWIISQ